QARGLHSRFAVSFPPPAASPGSMDHHSITPPPFHPGDFSDSLESDATVIGSARSSLTSHPFPLGITTRELAHALRGEMLGHFLLQQYIGGGGMGGVFKALDTKVVRIFAVI